MVYDSSIESKPEVSVEVMAEQYENSEDKPLGKLNNHSYEKSLIKSEKNGYDIEAVKNITTQVMLIHGIKDDYIR